MITNRIPQARTLTPIAAVLAAVMLLPALASAQSKSDVKIDAAVATNAAVMGGEATQNVDVGTAKDGGKSSVNVKALVATNAAVMGGSKAKQDLTIGKAEGSGSKSTVTADAIVATNAAVMGGESNQKLELGSASNGGTATVTAKAIVVTNAGVMGGSKANQNVNIGSAK